MSLDVSRLPELIRDKKRQAKSRIGDVEKVLAEVAADLAAEVEDIASRRARRESVIPELDFSQIRDGKVSDATKAQIRQRGTAVVRNVFPRAQAEAWNQQIGDYLASNDYLNKAKTRDAGDRYFTSLKSSRPQIFGVYWSKPQMEARQGVPMAKTKAFLNRLWCFERDGKKHFDPDRECTYADRIRRREPGDASLGLSPHMDAGSVERWLDAAYAEVYREVFAGNWRAYDPFDGASRTETEEIPSPAVCSAFRTFQGWTALTRQGPGDGTLQLLPIARAIVYLLLRPLAKDVP
ncbi:MAG TPA: YbiU family protein, partial [Dongiaceae bacterium]|nr:YbiU family protein [Dongiaceae bacterium]